MVIKQCSLLSIEVIYLLIVSLEANSVSSTWFQSLFFLGIAHPAYTQQCCKIIILITETPGSQVAVDKDMGSNGAEDVAAPPSG